MKRCFDSILDNRFKPVALAFGNWVINYCWNFLVETYKDKIANNG